MFSFFKDCTKKINQYKSLFVLHSFCFFFDFGFSNFDAPAQVQDTIQLFSYQAIEQKSNTIYIDFQSGFDRDYSILYLNGIMIFEDTSLISDGSTGLAHKLAISVDTKIERLDFEFIYFSRYSEIYTHEYREDTNNDVRNFELSSKLDFFLPKEELKFSVYYKKEGNFIGIESINDDGWSWIVKINKKIGKRKLRYRVRKTEFLYD